MVKLLLVKKISNIDFAVGLDGYTEIGIYDSRGDLIAKPVNKDLKAGNYTVSVPVSDMSSGAYYVKMVSGPFIKTESMIIAK